MLLANILERTSRDMYFAMVTWCSGRRQGSGVSGMIIVIYMERRGKNYWNPRQRQGLQGFFCYSHSRSLWPIAEYLALRTTSILHRLFSDPWATDSRQAFDRAIRSIISQYHEISGLKTNGWLSFVETTAITFALKGGNWFEPSSSPADGPAFYISSTMVYVRDMNGWKMLQSDASKFSHV